MLKAAIKHLLLFQGIVLSIVKGKSNSCTCSMLLTDSKGIAQYILQACRIKLNWRGMIIIVRKTSNSNHICGLVGGTVEREERAR